MKKINSHTLNPIGIKGNREEESTRKSKIRATSESVPSKNNR
jgi:hypothetical protein